MWLNHVYFTDGSLKLGVLPKIISTKHSLLYFFRNIRWLSALISTSYGRNPACISPSAFFKSWTPHHQKPWSRSIWSWSTSCGFQISSFITSRPLRLDGAIKEFQGFRCIFVILIPPGKDTFYHVDSILSRNSPHSDSNWEKCDGNCLGP